LLLVGSSFYSDCTSTSSVLGQVISGNAHPRSSVARFAVASPPVRFAGYPGIVMGEVEVHNSPAAAGDESVPGSPRDSEPRSESAPTKLRREIHQCHLSSRGLFQYFLSSLDPLALRQS